MGLFDFFKKNKKQTETSIEEVQLLEQPDFSIIDFNKVDDYYDWQVKLGERTIQLDLNFETETTNQSECNQIAEFVKRIPEFDNLNQKYILRDFKQEDSITSEYIDFYINELDETEIAGIIDLNNKNKSRRSLLLEKLNLIRVGIYPQATYFATFDYSIDIDGEPCNQLLVVNIYKNGTLDHITWES